MFAIYKFILAQHSAYVLAVCVSVCVSSMCQQYVSAEGVEAIRSVISDRFYGHEHDY